MYIRYSNPSYIWSASVFNKEASADHYRRLLFIFYDIFIIVLELVKKGANVKTADNKGRTPLHFAACRGDANMGRCMCPRL